MNATDEIKNMIFASFFIITWCAIFFFIGYKFKKERVKRKQTSKVKQRNQKVIGVEDVINEMEVGREWGVSEN